MSNYSSLKATINANVKTNGNQEITGAVLNSVLNAMVDSEGAGYQFMGVATPTSPGSSQTPDYKCFYLASTPGTYTYLGGLVVADEEVAILKYDSAWSKVTTPIASAAEVSQLGQKVIDIVDDSYADMDVADAEGNTLARFANGHIKTKNFDSEEVIDTLSEIEGHTGSFPYTEDADDVDLSIADEDNHDIMVLADGHIKTKNFDSKDVQALSTAITSLAVGEVRKVYAYADGDSTLDDDTHFYGWKNGKCAWQRAIDSCDGVTPTKIFCKGNIKVTSQANLFRVGNYYNVINITEDKANIELIGQGIDKTRVEVEMPDNLDISVYQYFQTMAIHGNNCKVKDMTIAIKNGRYAVHLDKSGADVCDGYTITFENCEFVHYQNDDYRMWSDTPFGLGISAGMHLITRRCGFVIPATTRPMYLHDNVGNDEGFVWDVLDCYCITGYTTKDKFSIGLMTIQTLGGGSNGVINIVNMGSGPMAEIYMVDQLNNNVSASHDVEDYTADLFIRITGQSFNPVGYYVRNLDNNGNLIDNTLNYPNAGVFRIKSATAGSSSKVRFDPSSTAFPVIIGAESNLATSFSSIKSPIVYADGYVYKDGVSGYSGYAHGQLAIAKNSSVASLSARLGDCSSTHLYLGVTIDGVSTTITFDQDYTAMTDAEIMTAINTQLSGAGVADIFIWGGEYFPEIKPSFHIMTNNSGSPIPNGTAVSFVNGILAPAVSDDDVFGVAIDDIYNGYDGRVLSKCILSMFANQRFKVRMDNPPATDSDAQGTAYQGRFGIGTTAGVLTQKNDGIFSADYYGYLVLNK